MAEDFIFSHVHHWHWLNPNCWLSLMLQLYQQTIFQRPGTLEIYNWRSRLFSGTRGLPTVVCLVDSRRSTSNIEHFHFFFLKLEGRKDDNSIMRGKRTCFLLNSSLYIKQPVLLPLFSVYFYLNISYTEYKKGRSIYILFIIIVSSYHLSPFLLQQELLEYWTTTLWASGSTSQCLVSSVESTV